MAHLLLLGSAKTHVVPPGCAGLGQELSCSKPFSDIHLSPPKMQGECSCSQVDVILCKNANITHKNAGGGRQVEATLGKVVSLPCKNCLGSERSVQ